MNNFNELLPLLDADFAIKCYNDYLKHCEKKASIVLEAFADIVNMYSDDEETYITVAQASSVFSSKGIALNTTITSSQGWSRIIDILPQLVVGLNAYINDDYAEVSYSDLATSDDIPITVYSENGAVTRSSTFGDIIWSIKGGITANAMHRSSIEAANTKGGVADRMAVFQTILSEVLGDHAQTSQGYNYYSRLVCDIDDPSTMIETLTADLGVDAESEEYNVPFLEMSNVYEFTGMTPMAAISVGTVADSIQAACSIGAKAMGSLSKKIVKGVRKIFRKIKSTVSTIVVNPYDVRDSEDPNEAFCFDGYQYQGSIESAHLGYWLAEYFGGVDAIPTAQLNLSKFNNVWYQSESIGAYHAIRLRDPVIAITNDVGSGEYVRLASSIDYIIKPKSLAIPVDSTDTLSSLLDKINGWTDSMYVSGKQPEKILYKSFFDGLAAHCNMIRSFIGTYVNDADASDDSKIGFGFTYTDVTVPEEISNRDFLNAACGANYTNNQWEFSLVRGLRSHDSNNPDVTNYVSSGIAISKAFAILMALSVARDSTVTAIDGTFFPYRKQASAFPVGRFSIKTDSENMNIANAFVTVAFAVAVVAVIALTGCVAVNAVKGVLASRHTRRIATLRDKMLRGQNLTPLEFFKYQRSQKKLIAISSMSMAAGASAGDGSFEILNSLLGDSSSDQFKSIKRLIAG